MPVRVPNLWNRHPRPDRLYMLALSTLSRTERDAEIPGACRRIRAHGRAAGRPRTDVCFTFPFEVRALADLGRYSAAWRQLRRWERWSGHPPIAPDHAVSSEDELWIVPTYHVPLLYQLGRFRDGLRLLEGCVAFLEQSALSPGYLRELVGASTDPPAPGLGLVTLRQLRQRTGGGPTGWEDVVRALPVDPPPDPAEEAARDACLESLTPLLAAQRAEAARLFPGLFRD